MPKKNSQQVKKLTARDVDALAPQPGVQYVTWDREPKGFGIRVSPAGTKTYILKYRTKAGRVRWATIGRVDDLALDKARDKAYAWRGLVAAGKDPLQEIDASRGAVTVTDSGPTAAIAAAGPRFADKTENVSEATSRRSRNSIPRRTGRKRRVGRTGRRARIGREPPAVQQVSQSGEVAAGSEPPQVCRHQVRGASRNVNRFSDFFVNI